MLRLQHLFSSYLQNDKQSDRERVRADRGTAACHCLAPVCQDKSLPSLPCFSLIQIFPFGFTFSFPCSWPYTLPLLQLYVRDGDVVIWEFRSALSASLSQLIQTEEKAARNSLRCIWSSLFAQRALQLHQVLSLAARKQKVLPEQQGQNCRLLFISWNCRRQLWKCSGNLTCLICKGKWWREHFCGHPPPPPAATSLSLSGQNGKLLPARITSTTLVAAQKETQEVGG